MKIELKIVRDASVPQLPTYRSIMAIFAAKMTNAGSSSIFNSIFIGNVPQIGVVVWVS